MLNNTYQITPIEKGSKNNMIQIFRALAIIAVVMIHSTPPGEWQVFYRPFINFAVATFLFLSGYLTKIENENWFAFYKKRITRVLIPYFIWSTVYSIPSIYNEGIDRLFKNLLTTHACVTLYYIFVYIQFILLTPLLGCLARSKYRYLGWLVAPISIIIFKYYNLFTGSELNKYIEIFWSNACLGWFTFYYLGLLLGNQILKKEFKLKILVILYCISIALQMAEGYSWFLLNDANCGSQLKLTSLLTSSIFLLIIYAILKEGHIKIENKFLRMLGDYSFGIYLCHIAVMMVLDKIPYYNIIPYPINSVIIILISLLCCMVGNKIGGTKLSEWFGLK